MRPMYHKDPMTPYCKAALKNQLTPFSWTKKARSPDSFWPISNKKQPQWRGEKNEAKGAELPNWETQHYLALLLLLRTSSRRVGKKEGRKKNGRKKKSLGGRMRPHAPQRSNDDILPSSLVTRALWIWRVWKNCGLHWFTLAEMDAYSVKYAHPLGMEDMEAYFSQNAPQRSNDDILPSRLVTRALWIRRVRKKRGLDWFTLAEMDA